MPSDANKTSSQQYDLLPVVTLFALSNDELQASSTAARGRPQISREGSSRAHIGTAPQI
jgi:hypothetical protein